MIFFFKSYETREKLRVVAVLAIDSGSKVYAQRITYVASRTNSNT